MRAARWRGGVVLCLVPALLAGCLSMDEPAPTTTPLPVSPQPSTGPLETATPSMEPQRDDDELIIAVPELPGRLLPPTASVADSIADDLVNRTLYRLGDDLTPVPDLASALPTASRDGLTWTIELALDGARFASGRPVTAADVVGSLALARAPTCPMDTDVCNVARIVDTAEASEEGSTVTLHLLSRFAPLTAEVLARLPILDMTGVDAAAAGIVTRAGDLEPTAPDKLVRSVFQAVGADACIDEEPPDGCQLADHRADLEGMLTDAQVPLPREAPFTDPTGQLDRAAYAEALLARVAALGQVLTLTGRDRRAATLGLLDGFGSGLGAGPYRVTSVVPGERMILTPIPDQTDQPAIGRIVFEAVPDAAVAATRLQAGLVDWVPRIDQTLADAIAGSGRAAHAGVRPLETSWVIVFNTRRGRPYADANTRAAFAMCIDREALTQQVGGGEEIAADIPLAAGSWGMTHGTSGERDVRRAERALELAGWGVGADGIRERDGKRLSSSVALRGSQVALLSMLQAIAEQLRECGIELTVEDLDVTGDRLLEQLSWPNDFDTLLTLRALGADPDADLQAFEGSHATSNDPDHRVDSNPGGFRSSGYDRRVARARTTLDQGERAAIYAEVQDLLATEVPAWWIWYETGWSAVADRVLGPDGQRIDPSQPRYEHDIRSWTLAPIPDPTPVSGAASSAPSPSATSDGGSPPPSTQPIGSASGEP